MGNKTGNSFVLLPFLNGGILTSMCPLTCLSCSSHRTTGCASGETGWPTEELAGCWAADYLPGADEREDWEQDHQTDQRKTNP